MDQIEDQPDALSTLPPIAVALDKRTKGANHLVELQNNQCPQIQIVTWDRAIRRNWPTDAHFVTYLPRDAQEGDPFVRCNKPIRQSLIDIGEPLEARTLVFDFDLPGHVAWSKTAAEVAIVAMNDAAAEEPLAASWTAWYTTRHGWRMIYVLASPIDVTMAEGVHRAMVARFQRTPLKTYIDTACSDWTRLFRLPKVYRDGVRTDLEAFFDSVEQAENRLDAWALHPHLPPDDGKIYAAIDPTPIENQPGQDEAKQLLATVSESTGRLIQSEFYKKAVARLKNRDVLAYIKGERKIWLDEHGQRVEGRNNKLTELIGSSVGLLYYMPGSTPEHIYALWVDPCEQMEATTGTDSGRGWLEIAWSIVRHCWDKEHSQAEAKRIEATVGKENSGQISMQVLEGVRRWSADPRFYGDDIEALKYIVRILIATNGMGHYFVMRADGLYDPEPVCERALPARIRELGMDAMIAIETIDEIQGRTVKRPIPTQQIITQHCTRFFAIEGHASATFEGTFIRDLFGDAATLVFRLYARAKLIPAFSIDVDNWLRTTFAEKYPDFERWVGHSLAFEDGPICALSLNGPPGIGKKLIIEGLAECITTQTVAHSKEMTGKFQSQLLRTPFLSVDEGFSKNIREGQNPADIFRSMVSGDTLHVERKGMGIVSIHNPLRIIITANNDEVIRSLYANQNLSPNDRRALAGRLMHMNLSNAGALWLRQQGGFRHTEGWVRGDSGKPSNYVIARHFMWMYKNRQPPLAGARFLVEGDANADIVREMATGSGDAPEVIEVILDMIQQAKPIKGFLCFNDAYFATVSAVKVHMIDLYKARGWSALAQRMTLRKIHSVLQGLSEDDWSPYPRSLPTANDQRQRWWKLDTDALIHHAEMHGVSTNLVRTAKGDVVA